MDKFEHKYGIIEDEKVKAFHKSRRMFCIYKNELFVADSNSPYSHASWFEREGWMTKEKDELINKITRGIIDNKGNIYFYIGYDFRINDDIEKVFFSHLNILNNKVKLNIDAFIYGGLIKAEPGKIWPPDKEYGKVSKYLK
ncbi:MAG: hypothetical protein Q8K30_06310 [Candidatus Gracilibacteria bacterium]|nr:hypothetical protein [Candidatus Gracilibacteria bacterium]